MLRPGDLVRCKMLGGIYTPLGLIIREANPTVYEVLVMHSPAGAKRQFVQTRDIEVINENR